MSSDPAAFLQDGGEMARRIYAYDWSESLGPISSWPGSLKTTVGMLVHSPVPIVLLWGEDGVMIYNDAYSVFAGGRHPRLLGSKVREGWPEVADFNDNVMKVGLAGGTLAYKDQELTLYRTGKPERVWMNLDYSPILDESGRPRGVIAIVVETTQRVLAERAIAAERDRFAQLFEQAPTFMAMLSGPEHRIELANPGYLRLVGHRPVIGVTVKEALADAVAQGYLELLDEVFATGEPFAANGARYAVQVVPGGPVDERYVDFVFQPIKNAAGEVTGIFVEGADVTDRAIADRALRESEARLRDLNADLERQVVERSAVGGRFWQISPDLLGVLKPDAHFESVNPAWTAMLGWSRDEVLATSIFDLLHPDDVEATRGGFETLKQGHPILRFENRYRRKDGGYKWFAWAAAPFGDAYYANGRDITAEKEAQIELAQAQEALRQAQKMEAVGQLTGGIAHDFNNLLAGIAGNLELLERRIGEGRLGGIERYIGAAQAAARRAATLTQRLLAFSRRQTLDPKPVDVNKLVAGMEDLIRRSVGPNVELEVVGAGGLWRTRIDPSQLENSLLNLCINARDAMAPAGGRLTIETANTWLDERAAKERELPPGQYVALCVTDTGTGMEPEVIARAFEPFFTTKPLGEGTGLGLSMIYGFVRQSGGQVRIYSEVGKGTTVRLYLPRHQGDAEDAPEEVFNRGGPAGAGETVLIIDDEPSIRALIVELLEDSGYAAIEAADGAAGLRILQSEGRIDLLITDVGLPGGLNGRQVADAARVVRPDLKVLFITGYAENAVLGNGALARGMEVITKPFPMAALAEKVAELIDR